MQDKKLVLMKTLDVKFQGGPVPLVSPPDPRLRLNSLKFRETNIYDSWLATPSFTES